MNINIHWKPDKKFTCPACKKASLLHNCVENGVKLAVLATEELVQIWEADLYRCPGCGEFVLTDFGKKPQWTKEKGWLNDSGKMPAAEGWLARIEAEAKVRGKMGVVKVGKG